MGCQMTSEDTGSLYALHTILVLVVALPSGFLKNKAWMMSHPDQRSFAWGFFLSYAACLAAIYVPGGLVMGGVNGLATAAYGLVFTVAGVFMYKRRRWAWLVGTLLSFNPIVYIINIIYLKNRWNEMQKEESAATGETRRQEP